MNCYSIRQQIDTLAQAEAPPHALETGLREHLRQCELCRRYYQDAMLARELQALDAPEPDADFVARSIHRAVSQPVPLRKNPALQRLAAVAASALLAVTLGLLVVTLPGDDPGQGYQPEPTANYQREEVKIVIYSEEHHDSAEFSIELAENLELEGYGSQRTLAWNTRLNKGANLLTLPVLVGDGGGEIRVMSRFGQGDHQVSVRVAKPKETEQPATLDEAALYRFPGVAG